MKITFLLQHGNARPLTRLKTMEHVAKSGWTVLLHPLYSPDLAPSDFCLFVPMKADYAGNILPTMKLSLKLVESG